MTAMVSFAAAETAARFIIALRRDEFKTRRSEEQKGNGACGKRAKRKVAVEEKACYNSCIKTRDRETRRRDLSGECLWRIRIS